MSLNGANTDVIAQLTQTSIGPSSSSTCAAAASTASASATSTPIASPRRPAASTSLAAASRPSYPRARMATSSPFSAKARTVARPTPADPPVTTTTRPSGILRPSSVTARAVGIFQWMDSPVAGAAKRVSDPYPPIGDYGLIGDCHSVALVSRTGSIDWACPRRFDAGSCFARILDWKHGGHFSITPSELAEQPEREYVENTMVLTTTFRTKNGECVLYDCATMRKGGARKPRRELLRVVEGVRGEVELRLHLAPRFDYGEVKAWIRHHGRRLYSAIGG